MERWYKISQDPNVPEVRQKRINELIKARSRFLIQDRINYFCDLVRGKDVLDIGVVEHTRDATHSPEWLHKHLCQAAKTCLGVDILDEEVTYLRSLGYDIIATDITKEPLTKTFDVIICGEVLEHVDAPGHLLSSAAKMIKPNGRVVVSVPNPWYVNVILKTSLNGLPYVDNADHVSWFDPCTFCEMGQRHGLVLDKYTGIAVRNTSNLHTQLFFGFTPLFIRLGFRPELFAKTMVYEFVLSNYNP